jgi:hypothetical protein
MSDDGSDERLDHLRRLAWRNRRFGDVSYVKIDSGDLKPELLPDQKALWQAAWDRLSTADQNILRNTRKQIGF